MTQSQVIAERLKKILFQKNITYSQLAKRLKMSEIGVKKMFSKTAFTVQRLEDICLAIDCPFDDLFRTHHTEEMARKLNRIQEEELALDEKLFAVFILVIKGATLKTLLEQLVFSETEILKLLRRLDKLGLIELHANNVIRSRVARHMFWDKEGPLREKYLQILLSQYIDSEFLSSNEFLDFLPIRASPAILQFIETKMEKLIREIRDLTDITEPKGDVKDSWILIGMRNAAVFSILKRYSKKQQ